jgi:hypothetical protein
MSIQKRFRLPQDANSDVIDRAMGMPILADGAIIGQPTKRLILGRSDVFVDIFDLTQPPVQTRMFVGIHVANNSAASEIQIVGGEAGVTSVHGDIIVPTQSFYTFDKMTFGSGARDFTKDVRVNVLRARLSAAAGVDASATIIYTVPGQPADQDTLTIHDKIYEFSNDESKQPGNNVLVAIGGSADATWTNLTNAINANEQAVRASIVVGTDTITIESNYGGTLGNGIVVADGTTGATFSGNLGSVAVGTGGVQPLIHIW